jgi:predicted ribosome-associated RNA-binding protein Tma20
MMIQVGDNVVANYGAMFPTVDGEVVKCNADGTYTVMFDDGAVRNVDNIMMPGERSVNGSPIGIHLKNF